MKIYKIKEKTPIIFDHYPKQESICLVNGTPKTDMHTDSANYWGYTTKRISDEIANFPDVCKIHTSRSGYIKTDYGYLIHNRGNIVVIYREGDVLKAAVNLINPSPAIEDIMKKFAKKYGVKQKNIEIFEPPIFRRTFFTPITFGLRDLDPEIQKKISSEFIKSKLEVTTEEVIQEHM
jgi:hypothetical protein